MEAKRCDALVRDVKAAASRRAALGAAALLAALAPRPMAQGKGRGRGKSGKKARNKCQQQVGQCQHAFVDLCEDEEDCLAISEACCPLLGGCNAGAFVDCLFVRI